MTNVLLVLIIFVMLPGSAYLGHKPQQQHDKDVIWRKMFGVFIYSI